MAADLNPRLCTCPMIGSEGPDPECPEHGDGRSERSQMFDLMIECRVMTPWVDRALRSESPDRWRLAFAEMLDHAQKAAADA